MNLKPQTNPTPRSFSDVSEMGKPAASRSHGIRAGQTEEDSYNRLVRRLRRQFLCPNPTYQPVVLPPIAPSTLRPEKPRVRSLSELLHISRRVSSFKGEAERLMRPRSLRRTSVDPLNIHECKTTRREGLPMTTTTTTTYPMVSTNSSNQTLHSRGSTDIESSHHKRYSSLGRNNKRSISIELDSFSKGEMDVYLWISDLETAVRDHITRVEVSERHTVFEMMALNYMNFVLKPEIDYLMKIERTSRGGILFEEEKARDQLLHQTPLVCTIAEEMRAHLKRSLKMTKLDALRREKELNPITNSTNIVSTHLRTDKRNSEASPEDDARRIVQRYLKAKRRQIDEKGGDSNNGNIHCPSIQMRHSFSAFVQAMGTVEDVPDPNLLLFSEGSRRLSNPTVPLINSVRGIGRKAIGISELVPLIDKVTVEHRALVRSEQEERQSIMEMARNEAEGVVKWEHKRMHLERLFFWREQRYRALGEDLRNTVEEMVCKFRAKSIDPAVEAQLRLCEKAENTARIGIDNEEKTFRVLLSTRHDKLYQLYYRNGLVKAYKKAWEETYSEALLGFSGFIVENEKNIASGFMFAIRNGLA